MGFRPAWVMVHGVVVRGRHPFSLAPLYRNNFTSECFFTLSQYYRQSAVN